MSYKTLAEGCYYKTGRKGVVFEALDNMSPNLFDNNRNINNDILSNSSKFRFTIVDSRKGKGRALYYNLDPSEMILLNYLMSDGVPNILKKRLGAYNNLSGQEQVELRNIVEAFPSIDYKRFDRMLDYSANKESTSITFQKNILDLNSPKKDKLIIKKIRFSYEEAMSSSSKFKVFIEDGKAVKDFSKGNGLNIVKAGTYKSLDETYLMLTKGEFIIPIAEGAKRVILANQAFYGQMKRAEKIFTSRKFENEDFEGNNIDKWNPEGKSTFVSKSKKESKKTKGSSRESASETDKEIKKEKYICSSCEVSIDDNVYNYSTRVYKKALCLKCQNEGGAKESKKEESNACSSCEASIDSNIYNYSVKHYNKPLCLTCQKENKKENKEDKKEELKCAMCKVDIISNVANYSKRKYGKFLCMSCQQV